jgi:DNA polymerase-1
LSEREELEHHCYIDGSNFIHRAWHVAKPRLRKVDGRDFGATWLFSTMLMRLMEQMKSGRRPPTHIGIFFDPGRESTWRKKEFPEYKSNRPPTDPGLRAQIPLMQSVCAQIGIASAVVDGFEADDLLAAYTNDAAAKGATVSILSGDKDLMQLVRPGVLQYNDLSKKWFRDKDVEEKFGVATALVADFLAMAGDTVDGIPGVKGVGPKFAVQLLTKYGGLLKMLENLDVIEEQRLKKLMSASADDARMSYKLTVLPGEGTPRPIDEAALKQGIDIDMRGRTIAWLREKTD